MLDPTALEAATDAAMAKYDDQTAPTRCESWRRHMQEIVSDAIRTYLSTVTPAEVGGLVVELRNPDFRGSMQHLRSAGEIDRLFQQSATALEAKEAELAEAKTQLDCALIREGNEKHRAKIAHQNMNAEINARDRAEALSRTGAVKVDDIDRRAKEAADAIGVTPHSDMRLFVEQAAKYAISALETDHIADAGKMIEPVEADTKQPPEYHDAAEAIPASTKTEGQQPVAWRYRFVTSIYGDLSDWFMVDDLSSIPPRDDQTIQPLFTRPSEQALTEADWKAMFFWNDQKRRLWWISHAIATMGRLNRGDICEAFCVSVPQASKDICEWMSLHPGAIIYDRSSKCYVPALKAAMEAGR